MNIYTEAFANVSMLHELIVEDFSDTSGRTYESMGIALGKGAKMYKIYGTKVLLMSHSDKFKTTPNEVSWYEVLGLSESTGQIEWISNIDESKAIELIPIEVYEEIYFFLEAARGG